MSSISIRKPFCALVATHDDQQRATIEAGLALFEGTIVTVNDAAGLWPLVTSRSFDVAIIDIEMPGLDAPGLVQHMRGHPRSKHLPIVVATDAHDDVALAATLAAGASSFFISPTQSQMIEHRIASLLRLVGSARQERTQTSRSLAVHRGIEAILGNLAGEAAIGTAWLDEEIEALRRLPLPPDAASMVMHRVTRIARECQALQDHAAKASIAICALTERVMADDRKERLEAILAQSVDDVAAGLRSRPDIRVQLPCGDTWIACDAEGLQDAIGQLILNALSHSQPEAHVCVKARIYADGLLGIEVTDSGLGMHPEMLARTFAPLQSRLDGSRAGPYMGFGLLFAKAVAEAHGGGLEVRSMPDQGTTVLLTLPPDRVVHEETKTSAAAA